jgi:RNA polymerase sigma-70 factor, ECF subfamily
MSSPTSTDVSQLLFAWSRGDADALTRLMPLVYDELRRLAGSYLRRERADHTLQPTALVHEAFLKLVGQELNLQNRAHFFGVAAQVMRCILVDHARGHDAAKRGSGVQPFALEEVVDTPDTSQVDVLALDEALNDLTRLDPQQARIVELRYFGGLTIEETAEVLGLSPATVKREWRLARTWLHRELSK